MGLFGHGKDRPTDSRWGVLWTGHLLVRTIVLSQTGPQWSRACWRTDAISRASSV